MSNEERKLIGYVGVDSGQLFITDPGYLLNGGWKDEDDPGVEVIGLKFWGEAENDVKRYLEQEYQITPEERGSAYFIPVDDEHEYDKLAQIIRKYADSINKVIVVHEFTNSSYDLISDVTLTEDAGEVLDGVAFSSGLGDGSYPVYATFREIKGWGKCITKVEIELISDETIKQLKGDL